MFSSQDLAGGGAAATNVLEYRVLPADHRRASLAAPMAAHGDQQSANYLTFPSEA
jgi:hypothetical protein